MNFVKRQYRIMLGNIGSSRSFDLIELDDTAIAVVSRDHGIAGRQTRSGKAIGSARICGDTVKAPSLAASVNGSLASAIAIRSEDLWNFSKSPRSKR